MSDPDNYKGLICTVKRDGPHPSSLSRFPTKSQSALEEIVGERSCTLSEKPVVLDSGSRVEMYGRIFIVDDLHLDDNCDRIGIWKISLEEIK